ncbi:MAG: UvrD-helicase domain-containing protein, partial [Nocardioidaceae bacterium]
REYRGGPAWSPPTIRTEDDGYAHVLVDEAQDLTPMQWRMVGRRGRGATWTIVGDPAQSSWPWPDEAAVAREAALVDKPEHAFHLSTNYRNSKEIYDFAAAYAGRVGLDADLPTAVRATGVVPVEAVVDDLEAGVATALQDVLAGVEGTVAVVVPVARIPEATRWLADAPVERVSVVSGLETKGLEFDGIVVVQPAEIENESVTGRATLYVVLTRATQRLVTISS